MSKKLAHTSAVSNSRLVEIYNELADRPVKKFSDSSAAQRRTKRLIEASGMVLVTGDDPSIVWLEVKEEFEASLTAPKNSKPAVSRRSVYNDDAPIDVNVGHNPKRKGSKSFKRFQILVDNPGLTVAEYRTKCLELEAGHGSRKALADLRWDEKHQYITVWTLDLLASSDFDISGFSEEYQAKVAAAREDV